MPKEDAYIAALLEERGAYERRGLTDRVKDVDAELAAAGYAAKSSRATKTEGKAVQSAPERRG